MPDNIKRDTGAVPQLLAGFLYDGDGKRAKKTANGNTTYYIGDHYEIKNGIGVKYIFAGNLRVAMVKNGTVTYFHKDHLGSSTLTTNAAGNIVESADYMPYGGKRDTGTIASSNYHFTDQEWEPETGLYNYDARLYDPVIGRFVSADTIVPGGGYDPQMLDRYVYVRNNPLRYVDPSGHSYGQDEPGGSTDWGGHRADGTVQDKDWARAKDDKHGNWRDHYSGLGSYKNRKKIDRYGNEYVLQKRVVTALKNSKYQGVSVETRVYPKSGTRTKTFLVGEKDNKTPFEEFNQKYIDGSVEITNPQYKMEILNDCVLATGVMLSAGAVVGVSVELYPAAMAYAGTPQGQIILKEGMDFLGNLIPSDALRNSVGGWAGSAVGQFDTVDDFFHGR